METMITVGIITLCICNMAVLGIISLLIYTLVVIKTPFSSKNNDPTVPLTSTKEMTQDEEIAARKAREADKAFAEMMNYNVYTAYGMQEPEE